ncbi:MAG: KpsF/GutQ family sugar-phosphate isomerase [Acidobacteria bacterium]|nr:KpsF/GutQ family sugar-phosphate isomerase [Acidobacteriota bacterium]
MEASLSEGGALPGGADLLQLGKEVLQIEASAIREVADRINLSFGHAIDLLADCRGRVVVSGMGKSGLIGKKIAATLASTGTPALFLHPAEAIHGDLGMLVPGDVALLLSNSGETEELLHLLQYIKRTGIPLISMVGNPASSLSRCADVVLDISISQEACPFGLAPTASTTAALALGDALAIALARKKGFKIEDFARLHPGGRLGKKFSRVCDLMHHGKQVPVVSTTTPMDEVIYEMSHKGLGITTVVDESWRLAGVISDGDLRRLLQKEGGGVLSRNAGDCMTRNPVTIKSQELAARALHLMEQRKITSLVVTDEQLHVEGILHLHDLWGTGMF